MKQSGQEKQRVSILGLVLGLGFLSVVGYVFGIVLLRQVIFRGADHPVCAGCGYDVRTALRGDGDERGAACCPECGIVLAAKEVEWASQRRERRLVARFIAPALVVVSAVLLSVFLAWGLLAILFLIA